MDKSESSSFTFLEEDEGGADVAEEARDSDEAAEDPLDPEREPLKDLITLRREDGAVQVIHVLDFNNQFQSSDSKKLEKFFYLIQCSSFLEHWIVVGEIETSVALSLAVMLLEEKMIISRENPSFCWVTQQVALNQLCPVFEPRNKTRLY